jgi:hypothetical protein
VGNLLLALHLDAGPQITDVDTGVWASVLMLLLFVAIALLLWSFFRRYKKASKAADFDKSNLNSNSK